MSPLPFAAEATQVHLTSQTRIVAAIIGLSFGLYALVAVLLFQDREAAIPGELWLAAGVFGGALVSFLSNSKGGQEGGTTGPLEVVAPPDQPLAVREAQDDPVIPHRLGGVA